jgi:hypothetical protein
MTSDKVLAETTNYVVKVETVKSQVTLSGTDKVYTIENKETGVVEGRAGNLPDALGYMHNVQLGYDSITKQAGQLASAESVETV